MKPAELGALSLEEFGEQVEAWNEFHSDSTTLTDREADGLSDVLDRMAAEGSA